MPDTTHLALFADHQLENAAEAVSRLRSLGIRTRDIAILSGVPYSDKILGRPMQWTRVPLFALAGAALGFGAAMTMNVVPLLQYPLTVGGQPLFSIPTSIVVTFEITMLGMLITTFLGVFLETITPSFGPKGYHPKISDGYIGVLFTSPERLNDRVDAQMTELGAELIPESEVIKP